MTTKVAILVATAACTALLGGVGGAAEITRQATKLDAVQREDQSRRSKGRTVEATYSTGVSVGLQDLVTVCVPGAPINSCVFAPAGANEVFVSIEIVDASGLPVPAIAGPHDDDPSGEPFCGSTTEPIPVIPGIEAEVVLNAFDPAVPCPGVATSGTVRFTFFKRR